LWATKFFWLDKMNMFNKVTLKEQKHMSTHAITGAFGYSGKYIAQQLLDQGQSVITLTNAPLQQNPFGEKVRAFPLDFTQPHRLAAALEGVEVLYNTYWVRFNHIQFNHATAVKNTLTLFEAAQSAGVQRIVHISITNPHLDSPLEYFYGKAQLEKALIDSGLSYAILRPTVLFGREDILINNIAWMLRQFPIFGVFGAGQYRLQPIYVDDLACLAVEQGQSRANRIINAIGPETFTYKGLVQKIGEIIGCRRPIVPLPPSLGYWIGRGVGWWMQDVTITREEIRGLMADLLYVDAQPAGHTSLRAWTQRHRATLGRVYASELARRRR
jgi:NADH dehydrogenase